jgi:hypothetical protein
MHAGLLRLASRQPGRLARLAALPPLTPAADAHTHTLTPSRPRQAASNKKGGLLNSMRQLADGHWVLAFADAGRSGQAKLLVSQHSETLREAYSRHLAPLTEATPKTSGGGAAEAPSSPAPARVVGGLGGGAAEGWGAPDAGKAAAEGGEQQEEAEQAEQQQEEQREPQRAAAGGEG